MRNTLGLYFFLFWSLIGFAQEVSLPEDLRQHNLTQFNSSLLNPTFAFDWNKPSAVTIWSRWQWQTIDGDPTTLFLNYTGSFSPESAFGVGFLQHNTGTFLHTGGLLNYVHALEIGNDAKLLVGANVLAFQRELADDRFVSDDDLDLPQLQDSNEFLLQFTPAARLMVNNFSLALALGNAFDINLSGNGGNSSGSIFLAALSNDFPINLLNDNNSLVRPMIYVKSIPNSDTQVGINALLSTSKFWAQAGYNSFYGPSAGVGITFLKSLSLGGLLEFPTGSDLSDESTTFELLLSYNFGKVDNRKKVVGFDVEEEEEMAQERSQRQQDRLEKQAEKERLQREAEEERQQRKIAREEAERQQRERDSIDSERRKNRRTQVQDSINQAREERRRAQVQDSIDQARVLAEQRRIQDSLETVRKRETELLREQQRLDSIAALQDQEVEVRPDEKYEEVATADGLQPGFYLIANVFGTKKYFENFMKTLHVQGLNPKSFYRSLNGYNYVYLERYDTIEEARKARDSRFDGRYPDKTWIFRVRRN